MSKELYEFLSSLKEAKWPGTNTEKTVVSQNPEDEIIQHRLKLQTDLDKKRLPKKDDLGLTSPATFPEAPKKPTLGQRIFQIWTKSEAPSTQKRIAQQLYTPQKQEIFTPSKQNIIGKHGQKLISDQLKKSKKTDKTLHQGDADLPELKQEPLSPRVQNLLKDRGELLEPVEKISRKVDHSKSKEIDMLNLPKNKQTEEERISDLNNRFRRLSSEERYKFFKKPTPGKRKNTSGEIGENPEVEHNPFEQDTEEESGPKNYIRNLVKESIYIGDKEMSKNPYESINENLLRQIKEGTQLTEDPRKKFNELLEALKGEQIDTTNKLIGGLERQTNRIKSMGSHKDKLPKPENFKSSFNSEEALKKMGLDTSEKDKAEANLARQGVRKALGMKETVLQKLRKGLELSENAKLEFQIKYLKENIPGISGEEISQVLAWMSQAEGERNTPTEIHVPVNGPSDPSKWDIRQVNPLSAMSQPVYPVMEPAPVSPISANASVDPIGGSLAGAPNAAPVASAIAGQVDDENGDENEEIDDTQEDSEEVEDSEDKSEDESEDDMQESEMVSYIQDLIEHPVFNAVYNRFKSRQLSHNSPFSESKVSQNLILESRVYNHGLNNLTPDQVEMAMVIIREALNGNDIVEVASLMAGSPMGIRNRLAAVKGRDFKKEEEKKKAKAQQNFPKMNVPVQQDEKIGEGVERYARVVKPVTARTKPRSKVQPSKPSFLSQEKVYEKPKPVSKPEAELQYEEPLDPDDKSLKFPIGPLQKKKAPEALKNFGGALTKAGVGNQKIKDSFYSESAIRRFLELLSADKK